MLTIVAATLVAGSIADEAAARRRKPKSAISAIVNGKRIKFARKTLTASRSGDSVVFGAGGVPRRLGQTLKGLAVGCAVALSANVFPVAGQFCTLGYSEIKFGPSLPIKQWASVENVTVIFESFDGTRLRGTFAGTLPPSNPNADYGPVTITDGKFSVVFDQ